MNEADSVVTEEDSLMGLCICPGCQSYKDCDEVAFCIDKVGQSECIGEEKGCVCRDCAVYGKLGLRHLYFCTRGSNREQQVTDQKKASDGIA